MEEVKETVMVLAVVERNKRVDLEVLEEVQSLIKEYRDVFPDGLASSLPPERGIRHHIGKPKQ